MAFFVTGFVAGFLGCGAGVILGAAMIKVVNQWNNEEDKEIPK